MILLQLLQQNEGSADTTPCGSHQQGRVRHKCNIEHADALGCHEVAWRRECAQRHSLTTAACAPVSAAYKWRALSSQTALCACCRSRAASFRGDALEQQQQQRPSSLNRALRRTCVCTAAAVDSEGTACVMAAASRCSINLFSSYDTIPIAIE
jgi:hypothetical protein